MVPPWQTRVAVVADQEARAAGRRRIDQAASMPIIPLLGRRVTPGCSACGALGQLHQRGLHHSVEYRKRRADWLQAREPTPVPQAEPVVSELPKQLHKWSQTVLVKFVVKEKVEMDYQYEQFVGDSQRIFQMHFLSEGNTGHRRS